MQQRCRLWLRWPTTIHFPNEGGRMAQKRAQTNVDEYLEMSGLAGRMDVN